MKAFVLLGLLALCGCAVASTLTTLVEKPPIIEDDGEGVGLSLGERGLTLTSASIKYDFFCLQDYEGKYVALKTRDDSFVTLAGENELTVSATVIPTGNGNAPGMNGATVDGATAEVGSTVALPNKVFTTFNQGGGRKVLWRASGDNPYFYFRDNEGWTCTCERKDGKAIPSCETTTDYTQCCRFSGAHKTDPKGNNNKPPRERLKDDLYGGQCSMWQDTTSSGDPDSDGLEPDFRVTCSASGAAATESMFTYPTCGSIDHNIALGIGLNIASHHILFASQVSVKKFKSCTAEGVCTQGSGPHEDYSDETCLGSVGASAILIDKSSGRYQDGTPYEGVTCGRGLESNSTERASSSHTSCGVGGNPCLTDYSCALNGGTCFPPQDGRRGVVFGTDVLENLPCVDDGQKKCPIGCRCNQIYSQVNTLIDNPCPA